MAIAPGGTHDLQEKYASQLLRIIKTRTPISNYASMDYRGEITLGGGSAAAVRIPVRDITPTVSDYDVMSGAPLTQSSTTYLNFPINRHKAINEIIDGFEAAAVPDNLVQNSLVRGGIALGKTIEANAVATLMQQGTVLANTTPTDDTNAYKVLKDVTIVQKKLGVDAIESVIFISADVEGALLEDTKFTNTASDVGSNMAAYGITGRINGINVVLSNTMPPNVEFIFVGIPWFQYLLAWESPLSVTDIKDARHIGASALVARLAFAHMVTRPETCLVKTRV